MARPRRSIAALAATFALLALTVIAQASEHGLAQPTTASARPAHPPFTVRGHVDGLFPGARTTLQVSLRNPNPYPIVVTRVRTTVLRTGSACPAGTVRIKAYMGVRRVRAHGVARISLPIRMAKGAPEACEGQRYPLAYSGQAILP